PAARRADPGPNPHPKGRNTMSTMNATLEVDGVELERGSLRAVALYEELLRDALAKLREAESLSGWLPDAVDKKWRAAAVGADTKLGEGVRGGSPFRGWFR